MTGTLHVPSSAVKCSRGSIPAVVRPSLPSGVDVATILTMAGRAARRRRPTPARQTPPPNGEGVDASGGPVIDPTKNVLDLVAAAIARQDDLRAMESDHLREVMKMRADYDQRLREAETARIDAIRAVDVGAVNRAAEVAATQAQTLATQVATVAEAMRTQVAAAATAASVALAAALEPIQRDIADLRRVQYETQGGKSNVVETREARGDTRLNLNTVIMAAGVVIAALVFVFGK
jgi:hypothetical protein